MKKETLELPKEIDFANEIEQISEYDKGRWYGRIEGAKWQMERMYSEEDMKKCWDACERFDRPISEGDAPNFNEFIEQFKKKL